MNWFEIIFDIFIVLLLGFYFLSFCTVFRHIYKQERINRSILKIIQEQNDWGKLTDKQLDIIKKEVFSEEEKNDNDKQSN